MERDKYYEKNNMVDLEFHNMVDLECTKPRLVIKLIYLKKKLLT